MSTASRLSHGVPEPPLSAAHGLVAQWSEQWTHNPSVAGSIPAEPTAPNRIPGGSVPAGIVETKHGSLQGAQGNNGVWSWKGVPFAAPPVGHLRFRPPSPPEPWAGVRAATTFGARAEQPAVPFMEAVSGGEGQSEDCL